MGFQQGGQTEYAAPTFNPAFPVATVIPACWWPPQYWAQIISRENIFNSGSQDSHRSDLTKHELSVLKVAKHTGGKKIYSPSPE